MASNNPYENCGVVASAIPRRLQPRRLQMLAQTFSPRFQSTPLATPTGSPSGSRYHTPRSSLSTSGSAYHTPRSRIPQLAQTTSYYRTPGSGDDNRSGGNIRPYGNPRRRLFDSSFRPSRIPVVRGAYPPGPMGIPTGMSTPSRETSLGGHESLDENRYSNISSIGYDMEASEVEYENLPDCFHSALDTSFGSEEDFPTDFKDSEEVEMAFPEGPADAPDSLDALGPWDERDPAAYVNSNLDPGDNWFDEQPEEPEIFRARMRRNSYPWSPGSYVDTGNPAGNESFYYDCPEYWDFAGTSDTESQT